MKSWNCVQLTTGWRVKKFSFKKILQQITRKWARRTNKRPTRSATEGQVPAEEAACQAKSAVALWFPLVSCFPLGRAFPPAPGRPNLAAWWRVSRQQPYSSARGEQVPNSAAWWRVGRQPRYSSSARGERKDRTCNFAASLIVLAWEKNEQVPPF